MDNHYAVCSCNSSEHVLEFCANTFDTDPGELIYTQVQLRPWDSWYKRLWAGIRYIFGFASKHGHWDCTLMSEDEAEKLSVYINAALIQRRVARQTAEAPTNPGNILDELLVARDALDDRIGELEGPPEDEIEPEESEAMTMGQLYVSLAKFAAGAPVMVYVHKLGLFEALSHVTRNGECVQLNVWPEEAVEVDEED